MAMKDQVAALAAVKDKQTWPTTLLQTVITASQSLGADGVGAIYADLIAAWIYMGENQALDLDTALTLADARPWNADEALANDTVLEQVGAARDGVRTLSQIPTNEELAAAVQGLQAQLDWLMNKLGITLPGGDVL